MKNRHIYMSDDVHKKLKLFALMNDLALGKAIEKLLKIAEEKGEK